MINFILVAVGTGGVFFNANKAMKKLKGSDKEWISNFVATLLWLFATIVTAIPLT